MTQPQNNRPRDLPSLVVEAAALGDELAMVAGEVELLADRADSLARELQAVPGSFGHQRRPKVEDHRPKGNQ